MVAMEAGRDQEGNLVAAATAAVVVMEAAAEVADNECEAAAKVVTTA